MPLTHQTIRQKAKNRLSRAVFGALLGDPVADEIYRLLQQSQHGASRAEIGDHFGRNRSAAVARALLHLQEQGLARPEPVATPGRPAERWRVATQVALGSVRSP